MRQGWPDRATRTIAVTTQRLRLTPGPLAFGAPKEVIQTQRRDGDMVPQQEAEARPRPIKFAAGFSMRTYWTHTLCKPGAAAIQFLLVLIRTNHEILPRVARTKAVLEACEALIQGSKK